MPSSRAVQIRTIVIVASAIMPSPHGDSMTDAAGWVNGRRGCDRPFMLPRHMASFTGPPTAFHPECPSRMYLASYPASRSARVVRQPTWKPYAQ